MRIRLTDAADRDVDDIWSYVMHQSASSDIANHLVDQIFDRISLLGQYPYIGPSRTDILGRGRRSLTAGEYVIIYTVAETEVSILRVVHGRRNLGALFDL